MIWSLSTALRAVGACLTGGAAARNAQRVNAILSLSADWYWETDAQHRFTALVESPRFAGTPFATLRGRRRWELPGVDPSSPVWESHRRTLDRHERFVDFAYSRADAHGSMRHIQASGEPRFDRRGRFVGYRGIARDVTGHLEAEAALNSSESQLAAIIDAAMDAVVTVDENLRVVVFNDAASRMFVCGRAQALGRPLSWLVPGCDGLIAPTPTIAPSQPEVVKTLARSLATDARRLTGETFQAEATVSRIPVGRRVLHCLVLRDLTERRAAEKARDELEAQLRQSQKMEAIGTLASGIAHDFNNIVGAIRGNTALAREHVATGGDPAAFLAEIERAGLRARELVQRLMAFSRREDPVFACQPLQPLLIEGLRLLRALVPSGIAIEHELPERLLHARVDGLQLQQVLMNLGTNAWQAIGSQPGTITVELAERDGDACLTVSDTGRGIDEQTRQRIFEPFFTTRPQGEGTGLGLSVVHGIVRSHGGTIHVRSEPGRGAAFEIRLPLQQAAAPAPAPVSAAPATEGHGEHVVYLDDYPAMVLMMRATLEALGYRFTGFEDAMQGLEWLEVHAEEVDVVVSDFNMPGCSGLDIARRLRARRPSLPVILASGLVTDELRESAAAAGVRHVFDKAGGPAAMCEAVAQLVAPAVAREEKT